MTKAMALNEILNTEIEKVSPQLFELLSKKGKNIFFPRGILYQGQQAKQYKAEINATIGTALGDNRSPMVLSSVNNSFEIEPEHAFPYAPSGGVAELRDKWKEKIITKNPGLDHKCISRPVVTSALTHGLSMLGYMFVEEGDKIIVANLNWGNYKLIFEKAYGASLEEFNFFTPEGGFDLESFKETFEKGGTGKKIVLLNFPNNPSGYTPTEEAVAQLKDYLKEKADAGNRILTIIDDAYFGLVYEKEKNIYRHSIFVELADLHENILAVKVDGITKEEFAWGLRVGFLTYGSKCCNPELYNALEAKTAGAIRGNISNASHLSQSLALEAFKSDSYIHDKKENFRILKNRYDIVKDILQKRNRQFSELFTPLPFNSGYFMCIQLNEIDAEKVRMTLLENYSTGVIAIPKNNLLRIAFSSTPTDKLELLFENIYNACKDVKNLN